MFKIHDKDRKFSIEAVLFRRTGGTNILCSELFNIWEKEVVVVLIDNTRAYARALTANKFTIRVFALDDISPPLIKRGSCMISWGFNEEQKAKNFYENLVTKWD